ncbi:hypothetical protein SPFM10_00073 [Salmonella phage SPFM10]|nr:hypothetical protein SPFM10_00073 [Salmonella phage SPFM10]
MPVVEKPMGIFLQGDAWVLTVDPCEDIVKVAEGNSYSDLVYDRAMFHRSLKDRSLCNLYIFWTELVDVAGDEDNCSQVICVRMLKPNELITGALNWFLHRPTIDREHCRIWTMEELYDEHYNARCDEPMPKQVPPQIPPLWGFEAACDVVAELVTETIARMATNREFGAAPMEDYDVLYKLTLHTQSLINCVEQYGWMSWQTVAYCEKKRCNMLRVVSESSVTS